MAAGGRIDDLNVISDKELDTRVTEWLKDLSSISASILDEGVEMLLLEKQRRVTAKLLVSSLRIEFLTTWLVGLTVILGVLTAALVVMTAILIKHGG